MLSGSTRERLRDLDHDCGKVELCGEEDSYLEEEKVEEGGHD